MAGAGGDLTTTVATAPTRITLIVTIGVIITATTTINDDNDSGAYELRGTEDVRLSWMSALPSKRTFQRHVGLSAKGQ
jgi:hypothetical protein